MRIVLKTTGPNMCNCNGELAMQHDEMTTSTTTTVSPPSTARPAGGCVAPDGRRIEEGDVVPSPKVELVNQLSDQNPIDTIHANRMTLANTATAWRASSAA